MKGTKRPAKKTPVKPAKNPDVVFAGGNSCVYCGKPINGTENTVVVKAKVRTRSFPVCCDTCRAATEGYVEKDTHFKKYMYLMILGAAVCIFISAVSANMHVLMSVGQVFAGLAFLIFPYPISTFETFQRHSIRLVITVCRIIGVLLIALGIFFAVFS